MKKPYVVGLLLLLLSGCASYSSSFQRIELLLAQQKPREALLELDKHPVSGADKLLYLLDKAMLQRMSGLYAESNASFEAAKKVIESLQGTSLVEQAGALTLNDSVMSYEGESFEQVYIHLYEALNYLALGQLDEARVEALQVDERFKALAEDNGESLIAGAFARYLAGMIYEAEGEVDQAMVSYRKAYEMYRKQGKTLGVAAVPRFLQQDLLRLSKQLGLMDEFEAYKKQFKDVAEQQSGHEADMGEVVLLLHAGLAPIKRVRDVFINTDDGVPVRISLPVYQSRPTVVKGATLQVGNISRDAVLVDNVDAMAKVSLEKRRPAMVARLVARAVAKAALSNKAEQQGGELAGLLVDVAAMATETADTRSWLTLPKHIYLFRMALPEGEYPALLTLVGTQGQALTEIDLGTIHIKSGRILFMDKTYIPPSSFGRVM